MNNFQLALSKLIYNEASGDFDQQLNKNIEAASSHITLNNSKIFKLKEPFNDSIRWKYISLAFDILLSLENNETVISLNYINDIKKIFQFIVSLGILPNLIPGIGINIEKRCKNYTIIPKETLSVQEQYYRLNGTLKGLLTCIKILSLRNFIITNHLNDLLAGLLQLNYAPVKKPSNELKNNDEFQMTDVFYNEIIADKKYFEIELNRLLTESYTPQLIKELMFFYGNTTSPKWLKITVYKILISKLMLNDGVESLIKALCDANIDVGSKWQQCDILVKILLTKPNNFEENNYYTNICSQILALLTKKDRHDRPFEQYEIIVSICIKYFYEKNTELCYKYLLNTIINKLLKFSKNNTRITENIIFTQDISQIINLWYNCVIQSSGMVQSIPINCITPIVNIFFQFYIVLINKSIFKEDSIKLNEILIKYLKEYDNKNEIFESFLFKNELQEHLEIVINENNDIEIKSNPTKVRINTLNKSETILNLIKNDNIENIILPLCIYLLEISIEDSPKKQINLEHLCLENEEFVIDETVERKLIGYNLLSNIVNNPKVQTYLQKNPVNIINFIEKTLTSFIANKLHKSLNCDSEQYQHMFLLIMIVNIISVNENLNKYTKLKNVLNVIYNETSNSEMKNLIGKIYEVKEFKKLNTVKSEFEKAMDDVCDPLLPVRGHGLMTIAKLLEEKNDEASSQKQYILNLCQQQIKDEDSYIYLNAIKVLAALGETFPDIIINILTDEYSNGCKDLQEKNNETRMKLGEVLLRVVKKLGNTAPKYKSILLNTFLTGVKDDDHLIRASSLSILGEICRVLGYKLGSVVNEVLSCIHAVIETDKAVEARRAAVSVIRWLFVGLEKDTILFLKEDILPIYRTLKKIYTSDPDDITRLQAQLALEELNANMRDFIFPKVLPENKSAMLN